jgi:hypothetical protein
MTKLHLQREELFSRYKAELLKDCGFADVEQAWAETVRLDRTGEQCHQKAGLFKNEEN